MNDRSKLNGYTMLKVLLFGSLADEAGCDVLSLEWQEQWHTVADVLASLDGSHPAISALLAARPRTLFAVNQHFAKRDTRIHQGDELALLPPVTGG